MSRSIRFHHTARLKAREKKRLQSKFPAYPEFVTPERIGFNFNTPKSCSCFVCGNSRKYLGRTLKELAGIATLNEELNDL